MFPLQNSRERRSNLAPEKRVTGNILHILGLKVTDKHPQEKEQNCQSNETTESQSSDSKKLPCDFPGFLSKVSFLAGSLEPPPLNPKKNPIGTGRGAKIKAKGARAEGHKATP